MKKYLLFCVLWFTCTGLANGQQRGGISWDYMVLRDSLVHLSQRFINHPEEMERKNANYEFIKTLVATLKLPASFNFNLDTLKAISVLKSPDNRFRIFTWHVMNTDGSYRFYGAIQMNSPNKLTLIPLEDYSPFIKTPKDTITDTHRWYGAQYYKIILVNGPTPSYTLLGWKGHTVESTKRVIEVLSFKNGQPVFGAPIFTGNSKTHQREVFEYSRQASMLLKYIPDEALIVFDHLSAPDKSSVDKPETFGPDLSYDGYKLKSGKWLYIKDLDMRNIAIPQDETPYTDPKKQAVIDRQQVVPKN